MGQQLAECLYPSNRIEEYSIGADLVKAPPSRAYTIQGIHAIRYHALHLSETKDPDDKQGVAMINDTFKRNDFGIANHDLKLGLDIPLKGNIIEWLGVASDNDIEQFCIWSFHRARQLTRAVQRDKIEIASHTMDKTEELVDNGLFPPIAAPVIHAAIQRYYLQGLDSFHGAGMNRVAFCGDYTIGVSNLYQNRHDLTTPSREMQRTLFHEYVHGGGNDRGFFNGLTKKHYTRILEEAFVEHATVVAHSTLIKQPRVIDPLKRLSILESCRGVYGAERTFLAKTCDYAHISIEQLSEAYFTPRGDRRGESLRKDIERKIGAFFGSRAAFYDFIDAYEEEESTQRSRLIYAKLNELRRLR